MKPPVTKKIKKKLITHGDERIDNYYWLRDDSRKSKEVLNYLTLSLLSTELRLHIHLDKQLHSCQNP